MFSLEGNKIMWEIKNICESYMGMGSKVPETWKTPQGSKSCKRLSRTLVQVVFKRYRMVVILVPIFPWSSQVVPIGPLLITWWLFWTTLYYLDVQNSPFTCLRIMSLLYGCQETSDLIGRKWFLWTAAKLYRWGLKNMVLRYS